MLLPCGFGKSHRQPRLFVFSWLFVKRVETDNSQRGVMIQASFRSNFLLLGMPLIQELCPGADLAASAVTVSTLLSAVTMFLWIFLFKSLGMF